MCHILAGLFGRKSPVTRTHQLRGNRCCESSQVAAGIKDTKTKAKLSMWVLCGRGALRTVCLFPHISFMKNVAEGLLYTPYSRFKSSCRRAILTLLTQVGDFWPSLVDPKVSFLRCLTAEDPPTNHISSTSSSLGQC